MKRAKCAVAIVASLSTACGARSSLPFEDVAGTGGAQSTGGAGGAPPSPNCTALEQAGPVAHLQNEASAADGAPELVSSSDDQQQVTAVFTRMSQVQATTRHATFLPWSDWPSSSIGPSYDTPFFKGGTRRLARAPDNQFALLEGYKFAPRADAHSDAVGPLATVLPSSLKFDEEFVTLSATGSYLAGASGSPIAASIIKFEGPATFDITPLTFGCASSEMRADGVAYEDGWIVAFSNSAGADCSKAGPPTQIEVVKITPDGTRSQIARFDAGAPVGTLRAAPHPGGLYVAFKTDASIDALFCARVDAESAQVIGPQLVKEPTLASGFALTALGSSVALIWSVAEPALDPPRLVVRSENLEPLVTLPLTLPITNGVPLLASPDGRKLLAAWDNVETASPNMGISLTRIDCVP